MELAALEQQLNSWAEGYLAAGRLPCIAVALTRGSGEILLAPSALLYVTHITMRKRSSAVATYLSFKITKVKLLFLYRFYVLSVLLHYKLLSGDGGRVRPHFYVLR